MTGRRRTDAPDQAELDRKRALNAEQVVDYLARGRRAAVVAPSRSAEVNPPSSRPTRRP